MSRALLRHCLLTWALLAPAPALLAETWPVPDWTPGPALSGEALAALETYAFPPRDDTTRKGGRTDALLVIRDGQIVYERYAAPTTASSAHLSWSISKSLLATVLGVAYGEGRFQLDAPVARYYPPFTAHPQIKVGHLLNWASGLAWQEGYEYAPLRSSVVAMLYTRGRADMAAFTASHDADAAPGARFRYSSGDSNVLAAALRGMVGDAAYADYPWTALFEPVGVSSAVWERDAAGTFIASSYAYLSARDLARIGLLMQRDGRWQDRQLIPPAWIAFNRTPFANYQASAKGAEPVPGGHWWLNQGGDGAATAWPDATPATYAALGHWGQGLYIVPEDNLVIVRYADDRDGQFDANTLLRLVRTAVREVHP